MALIGYGCEPSSTRWFICVRLTDQQLNDVRGLLSDDLFESDLGSNGVLIDFARDEPNADAVIGMLTVINGRPIGDEPIMPSPCIPAFF